MKTIGIDVGSSSVKVSLLDVQTGECTASSTLPQTEMPITAVQNGWAEQNPQMWWDYVVEGVRTVMKAIDPKEVVAIGITYQMHGLVVLDQAGEVLRPSIIWCDSRAVEIGQKALSDIGEQKCLSNLLNSPGNFTASKLAWVKINEPEIYAKAKHFMLPGDYIAYNLSGDIATTYSGLSEQVLWDFVSDKRADFVAQNYGIDTSMIPQAKPSIGIQARVNAKAAALLGLEEGTPISYRAGDQPNNAFSLNVMDAGEIAATGGTSGVVYGVIDTPKADPKSRVNTFLHVNHAASTPRYGVLLCINGTGILNAWTRRIVADTMTYDQINDLCRSVPEGCEGLSMMPFGNGAERMLENRFTGACVQGIDLNRHSKAHLLRAAQEGIAFAFRYGIDIMRENGLKPSVLRAGYANLFLSPIFRQTLATLCNVEIQLYNTDGALGAARGAALGAGFYKNREECFATLKVVDAVKPDHAKREVLENAYQSWRKNLQNKLSEI